MRFAFGEDEVKRIAKAVKAFEQGQGSSDLKASGPRHVASHLSLVKVTTPETPYSTGKCVDFIASDGTYIEKETVKIKDIGGKTLSKNSYHVGYFAGYKQGEPVFFVTLGSEGGGPAVIDVVNNVTCTPTGIEISKVTLSGADYDNAVIRNFLALSDVTPKTFLGNQGRVVKVNDQGNALEFGAIVTGNETTFISLTDTPLEYGDKNTYKVVSVSSNNKSLVFSDNNVATEFSLTGGGNPNDPAFKTIKLVGDTETPATWNFYGTNNKGERGWYKIEGHQNTDKSIVGDGTFEDPIRLQNDEETPGQNRYYGTNDKGFRGWYETTFVTETLDSITGNGTVADPITLVNDLEQPGSNYFYGTNSLGVKGWLPVVTFTYVDNLFNGIDSRVLAIENAPYATEGYVITAVATETTNRQTADTALDLRVSALETTTDGHTITLTSIQTTVSGHTSDISSLQITVGNHASSISGLEADVNSLQGTVSSHTSSISSLQTAVNGHTTDIASLQTELATETTNRTSADNALDGRINTLEGQNLNSRLTTAEGSITTLQGEMTTAQVDINGLDVRLDVLESQTLNTRLTSVESAVTTLQGDVSVLDGRLTTAEVDITGLDGRVSTLESQTLDTRISTLESQTLDTRIATLEGQTLDTRLTTIEGQTLDTRVTTLEGYVSSTALTLGSVQVVGTQQAAISDAVGATIDDTSLTDCASTTQTAVDDLKTQLNEILAALRVHGLIAT